MKHLKTSPSNDWGGNASWKTITSRITLQFYRSRFLFRLSNSKLLIVPKTVSVQVHMHISLKGDTEEGARSDSNVSEVKVVLRYTGF